jgi:hypothetical protein
MFQLAILQDAIPTGAGYGLMLIILGCLSGALVALFQTLFAKLTAKREAVVEAGAAEEPLSQPGAVRRAG